MAPSPPPFTRGARRESVRLWHFISNNLSASAAAQFRFCLSKSNSKSVCKVPTNRRYIPPSFNNTPDGGSSKWVAQLALKRPYIVAVMAWLIVVSGSTSIRQMPTSIFAEAGILVITLIWPRPTARRFALATSTNYPGQSLNARADLFRQNSSSCTKTATPNHVASAHDLPNVSRH